MDLFSPLRLGVHVATDAVKLATVVPRLIIHQLNGGDDDQQRFQPADDQPDAAPPPPRRARPRARAPRRRAPLRARAPRPSRPPRPAPPAASPAPPPRPVTPPPPARPTRPPRPRPAPRRTVRQGERRASDVRPPRTTPARQRTEPDAPEVDRRRAEQREQTTTPETTLAETEGSAAPAATIRVDEPWDGYGADEGRRTSSTASRAPTPPTKAVVRLYEQTHKKRKSILDATGRRAAGGARKP